VCQQDCDETCLLLEAHCYHASTRVGCHVQHSLTLLSCCSVGSGKSTFAQAVVQNSPSSWCRINQDSLKSRKRCESVAKQSLAARSNVIIDRTNCDAAQRAHWVKIAAQFRSPCFALCFKYPVDVCASRGAARVHHEGGVSGNMAKQLTARLSAVLSGVNRCLPAQFWAHTALHSCSLPLWICSCCSVS
jgi:predicted kinase